MAADGFLVAVRRISPSHFYFAFLLRISPSHNFSFAFLLRISPSQFFFAFLSSAFLSFAFLLRAALLLRISPSHLSFAFPLRIFPSHFFAFLLRISSRFSVAFLLREAYVGADVRECSLSDAPRARPDKVSAEDRGEMRWRIWVASFGARSRKSINVENKLV